MNALIFDSFGKKIGRVIHSFSGVMTKEQAGIVFLFTIALVLRIIYFSHTDPFVRTADAAGHFEYIEFIAEKMTLPAISELEQSYHPPLYYFISAVLRKILSALDFKVEVINKALQFLSLCFHLGFLLAGTFIIKRFSSNKIIFFLCLTLFYFWPSSILHSARIGNDNLFYCFYGFSLLYLCKWHDKEKPVDMYLFALFSLLCMFTKANGIVIPGCFGIIILIKFFQTESKSKFVIKVLPCIVILVLGFLGLFLFTIIDALKGYEVVTFANRTNSMGWGAYIGIDAKNYLYFDLKIFMTEPFTDMIEDWGGRQYFWNYLLKTSLFGEFITDNAFLRNCATILSFLLLMLVLIMLLGIFTLKRRDAKTRIPIFLNLILLILSSAVYRFLSPIPCSNDFRYIFPVIVSFSVFIGSALSYLTSEKLIIMRYSAYGIGAAFIIFSSIYYVLLS